MLRPLRTCGATCRTYAGSCGSLASWRWLFDGRLALSGWGLRLGRRLCLGRGLCLGLWRRRRRRLQLAWEGRLLALGDGGDNLVNRPGVLRLAVIVDDVGRTEEERPVRGKKGGARQGASVGVGREGQRVELGGPGSVAPAWPHAARRQLPTVVCYDSGRRDRGAYPTLGAKSLRSEVILPARDVTRR